MGNKISGLVMSLNMHEFISTIPSHGTHKHCKSAIYKGTHIGMQNKQIIDKGLLS